MPIPVPHRSLRRVLLGTFAMIACGSGTAVHADFCAGEWVDDYRAGLEGRETGASYVWTLQSFDDGSGEKLYCGGRFFSIPGYPGLNHIAAWDGERFHALDNGLDDPPTDLEVWRDAKGEDWLVAAGTFTSASGVPTPGFARWNGLEWRSIGDDLNGVGAALAVLDGDLYVAGRFVSNDGTDEAYGVHRWTGSEWMQLGENFSDFIGELEVYDDGTGPALYAAGYFKQIGNEKASYIARWDGETWAEVGGGTEDRISALEPGFALDGSGKPVLYLSGPFIEAGGQPANHYAQWDGTSFSPLGEGLSGWSRSLRYVENPPDGAGPRLFASRGTGSAQPLPTVYEWDGASWTGLPKYGTGSTIVLDVYGENPSGGGSPLYAGTVFSTGPSLAYWTGSEWRSTSHGLHGICRFADGEYSHPIGYVLHVHDDGKSERLIAGGCFSFAATRRFDSIVAWDGDEWSALGGGINGIVVALATFDDGSGPALYAGGFFDAAGGIKARSVARWDGNEWSPLGDGVDNGVLTMAVFDDGTGPALYVAGNFENAGGVQANSIAKWNGSKWESLAGGLLRDGYPGGVSALAVFDDGSGPALYAAGEFDLAGSVSAKNIARWNGVKWTSLDEGVYSPGQDRYAYSLAVFDDGSGSGPSLYVGGNFRNAGLLETQGIARWNGLAWSQVDQVEIANVYGLTVFDAGNGPLLYMSGYLETPHLDGDLIAKWDGARWTSLDWSYQSGTSILRDLIGWVDPVSGDRSLFVTGDFVLAGEGVSSLNLARYDLCPLAALGDLNGDGVIGFDDLAQLLAEWGDCPPGGDCAADLDDDGDVDFDDMTFLLSNWS